MRATKQFLGLVEGVFPNHMTIPGTRKPFPVRQWITNRGSVFIELPTGEISDGDIGFDSLEDLTARLGEVQVYNKPPPQWQTEDGYLFIEMPNGKITDGDMSFWPDELEHTHYGPGPLTKVTTDTWHGQGQ